MSQNLAITAVDDLIGANDAPRAQFKLCGKKWHLTYSTHVDLEGLLTFVESVCGELVWYSLVHENGRSQPPLAYPHTHLAFECKKKLDRSNSRVLDFEGQHPNIKAIKTDTHAERIWIYHLKDPVASMRSEHGPMKTSPADLWVRACACQTLREAAEVYDLVPRTIMELKAIRADTTVDMRPASIDGECSWTLAAPESFHLLFVWGPTNTGKTRWAYAQFTSPLLVSHLEDLKKFRPALHDGIVFDDISLADLPPHVAIQIVDWEMPRTLNVKYGSVTLPARTRKIFTFNLGPRECFPPMPEAQWGAVIRRFTRVMHVTGPTYGSTRKRDLEEAGLLDPPTAQCTAPATASSAEPSQQETDTQEYPLDHQGLLLLAGVSSQTMGQQMMTTEADLLNTFEDAYTSDPEEHGPLCSCDSCWSQWQSFDNTELDEFEDNQFTG